MAPDLSLDYVYGEESSQTLADRIGVEDNIAERLSDDELKSKRLAKLEEVKERFKTALNPKERIIYEKRLFALEPATLQELGQELGITRERVRQLESGILKKSSKNSVMTTTCSGAGRLEDFCRAGFR